MDYDAYFRAMLIAQEINMYRTMGEQVAPTDFEAICKRRGFNKKEKNILKKEIKKYGLGELL